MQRWLHAAESQVGLTPARAADEIAKGGHIFDHGGRRRAEQASAMPRHIRQSGCQPSKSKLKGGHMRSLGQFARAAAAFAAAASLAGFATIAQAQDKGPIRIGFLPPITGPLASPGAEMV